MEETRCKVCGQSFKSHGELSEHQAMTHAQHGKLGGDTITVGNQPITSEKRPGDNR